MHCFDGISRWFDLRCQPIFDLNKISFEYLWRRRTFVLLDDAMPCGTASWFPYSINSRNSPKSTKEKMVQHDSIEFEERTETPTWFNWNSIDRIEIHYEANDENCNKDGTFHGLHHVFCDDYERIRSKNKDYSRSLGTNKKWNKTVSFLFDWMHIYNRSVCFSCFFFSIAEEKKKKKRRRKDFFSRRKFSQPIFVLPRFLRCVCVRARSWALTLYLLSFILPLLSSTSITMISMKF